MEIDQSIRSKLESAIDSLLKAGWNTHKIRDSLAKQQSFGKYDGCTPDAILTLANQKCREHNAEMRKIITTAARRNGLL